MHLDHGRAGRREHAVEGKGREGEEHDGAAGAVAGTRCSSSATRAARFLAASASVTLDGADAEALLLAAAPELGLGDLGRRQR